MTGTSAKNENLGTDAERHFFDYAAFGSSLRGDRSLTNYAFTGQVKEPKTGQQYQRARFYDPTNSRWLSPDTVSDVPNGSYSYCAGNPVNAVDPTGLFSMIEISSVSAGQAEAMMALRFNLGSGCTLGITPESVALENMGTGTGIAEGYVAITMFVIKFLGVYVLSTIFPIIGFALAAISAVEVVNQLWAATKYVLTQPGVPLWAKIYVVCVDIIVLVLAVIGIVKCGAAATNAFKKIVEEAAPESAGASSAERALVPSPGPNGYFRKVYDDMLDTPEGTQIWGSTGRIYPKDFADIVRKARAADKEVWILTGNHGGPTGLRSADETLTYEDQLMYHWDEHIHIEDISTWDQAKIQVLMEKKMVCLLALFAIVRNVWRQ